MLTSLIKELQNNIITLRANILFCIKILSILWTIQIINRKTKYTLNYLGTQPRSLIGLFGIFFSPFLHSNFTHLFINSFTFFVLSNLVLLDGKQHFYIVTITILFFSGSLLWIFGKKGVHIGISGVTMGYLGYLLTRPYFQISINTIAIACTCICFFGRQIISTFSNTKNNISFRGHICGFIAGIVVHYLKFIN